MKIKKPIFPASYQTLYLFSVQLRQLLHSGIPMVEALEMVSENSNHSKFSKEILAVRKQIQEGSHFSTALKACQGTFPDLFIQLVTSGEMSGKLEQTLSEAGEYYHTQYLQKKSLHSAMLYPVIVSLSAVAMVIFMVSYVLPIFADTYAEMGASLPWSTKWLLKLGNGLSGGWPFALLLILSIWMIFRHHFEKVSHIQRGLAYYRLKLPFFGALHKWLDYQRIANVFAILLDSETELLSSLNVLAKVTQNTYLKWTFGQIKAKVIQGEKLSNAFESMDIYDGNFYKLIRVGEESGQLEMTFRNIATIYQERIQYRMAIIMSMVEPLLLLLIGGVVLFIVVSIMLPIFDLYTLYTEML